MNGISALTNLLIILKHLCKKGASFLGVRQGAFVIHDQFSVQMIEFMLCDAGEKILVTLVNFLTLDIQRPDLDFRKTAHLDLDFRTGKTAFFHIYQLSPGLCNTCLLYTSD